MNLLYHTDEDWKHGGCRFTLFGNIHITGRSELEFQSNFLFHRISILIFFIFTNYFRWHHNQSHFSNPNSSSSLSDTRSLRRSSTAYQNRGLYLLPPTPYQPNLNNSQLPLNTFNISHLVSPTNAMSQNMQFQTESQPQNPHQNEVICSSDCSQVCIDNTVL